MIDLQKAAKRGDLQAAMAAVIPGVQFAMFIAYWITGVLALPFQVLVRYDFGERYVSWGNVLLAGLFFNSIVTVSAFSLGGWLLWLVPLYWVVAIGHLVYIRQRNARGERVHSKYDGTALLGAMLNGVSPHRVKQFVEPAVGAAVVMLVYVVGSQTRGGSGTGGFTSAVSLFGTYMLLAPVVSSALQSALRASEERHRLLDLIDAELEARYMKYALRGAPAKQTHGVTVAPQNVQLLTSVANDAELRSIIPLETLKEVSRLTPEEEALLDVELEVEKGMSGQAQTVQASTVPNTPAPPASAPHPQAPAPPTPPVPTPPLTGQTSRTVKWSDTEY